MAAPVCLEPPVSAPPAAVPHFLSIDDTTPDGLQRLVTLSAELKRDPRRSEDLLRGQTVLLLFDKPSARTRLSFEAATAQLGGSVVFVGPSAGRLGAREPIRDLARVVSRMASAIVVRTHDHADVEELARWSSVPVINGLTDLHHPCQALADMLTLAERFGGAAGLELAFVGDGGSNVCHSLLQAAARSGAELRVACPPGHAPAPAILDPAAEMAAEYGGGILVTPDAAEAVAGCRAVYTDVFVSMGEEGHAAEKLAALARYQVDAALMSRAADDAIFMHCLPAHRGQEVTDEVLDGPRSVVWDQAENRRHTAAGLLVSLLDAPDPSLVDLGL